ncbi:unnamed protein product [Scytosiphon promiscuus]
MSQRSETSNPQGIPQEDAELSLLRRLDALEKLVFGRSCSTFGTTAEAVPRRMEPLTARVEAVSRRVSRTEGGSRDLQDLATQAAHLGLLSTAPYGSTADTAQNVALKENILYAARGEIDTTARLLSQVKTLEEHVNPPYLRDTPQFAARLGRLEGTYIRQAAEAARINERAEHARLQYSEAVNLVSQKFVHWDDQVAELEGQHASRAQQT